MKKLLCILLIAILLFGICSLGGCNSANYGAFYSLEEAYENGYLTQEDLLSIAYYYNGGREGNEHLMPEDYYPKPIEPQELSNRITRKIKNTYKWEFFNDSEPKLYIPNFLIEIIGYVGKYGDCYVVAVDDMVIRRKYKTEDCVIGSVCFIRFIGRLKVWIEN